MLCSLLILIFITKVKGLAYADACEQHSRYGILKAVSRASSCPCGVSYFVPNDGKELAVLVLACGSCHG